MFGKMLDFTAVLVGVGIGVYQGISDIVDMLVEDQLAWEVDRVVRLFEGAWP